MTLLSVTHRTEYTYANPVTLAVLLATNAPIGGNNLIRVEVTAE